MDIFYTYFRKKSWLQVVTDFTLIAIAFFIPISTAMTNVLFLFAVVLIFLSGQLKSKIKSILNIEIAILFIVFWSLFVIGIFYSEATWTEAIRTSLHYKKFLFAGLIFVLLKSDLDKSTLILNVFLLSMVVIASLILFKYFGLIDFRVSRNACGEASIFKTYLQINFLMAYASFLSLVFCIYASRYKWLYFLMSVFFIVNVVVLSNGRTGYFVLFALLLYLVFASLSKTKMILFTILLMMAPFMLYKFSPVFQGRMHAMWDEAVHSQAGDKGINGVDLRIHYLRTGIKIMAQNKYIGTGTGSVLSQFKKNYPDESAYHTTNPHNEYINVGIQLGLFGLFYLLAMFYRQWRISGSHMDIKSRIITRGLIIAIMIGSLGNSLLRDPTEGYFYAYMIAVMFSQIKFKKKKNKFLHFT